MNLTMNIQNSFFQSKSFPLIFFFAKIFSLLFLYEINNLNEKANKISKIQIYSMILFYMDLKLCTNI
jgi:hypothetical protein